MYSFVFDVEFGSEVGSSDRFTVEYETLDGRIRKLSGMSAERVDEIRKACPKLQIVVTKE